MAALTALDKAPSALASGFAPVAGVNLLTMGKASKVTMAMDHIEPIHPKLCMSF